MSRWSDIQERIDSTPDTRCLVCEEPKDVGVRCDNCGRTRADAIDDLIIEYDKEMEGAR